MDKNIGEQLNKAYEAFRQACMDKDSAVKELQQKTENYEQRIREQQEKLSRQQCVIDKLKSELLLANSGRDTTHGYTPLLEDSETKKNDMPLNLKLDQLKPGIPREKRLKEQLENDSNKLKAIEGESNLKEKKLETILLYKEEEIRFLRSVLREKTERHNCQQMHTCDVEVRRPEVSSSPRQEVSPGVPNVLTSHERADLEKTFLEMKEELHRICMLTRMQTDHLSKFNLKNETAREIQFSMPIQCTDKTDEETEELFKPQVKNNMIRGASCIASITPRGLGQDEEDNSIESLSKFNIKFPPTDNDSAFLHSTPEKPKVLDAAPRTETLRQDRFDMKRRDVALNYVESESTSFEIHGIDPITSAIQNLSTTDKTKLPNHVNIPNAPDKTQCLPTGTHNPIYVNIFPLQDTSEVLSPSLEPPGRAIRGPQQPLWKPCPNQDNDLLAQSGTDSELHIPSRVCEFCQAVFPPSITSRGDFFRHLNSHFKGES
ncbi:TRAF family member-associated NF-kappa-B activator [Ornithorhynchus anatinus]|uniref:TRAF family member associated NFKB activator n=1 Tax=Ornithorhynchus anatinus TaxID=9258 RepID=F7AZG4_ORNAN|nr:TRAF family member-associated NF-kappa-B activator [Ornithorhynchus anatinus]XP_007669361.1 TRAF family member-associated NF-kappa-B activator [Ornithorhynchus anatinus]